MKILVTGGAGFIGSHLVKTLEDKGHDVLVIDNFSYSEKPVLFESKVIEKDIRTTSIFPHFKNIDVVFHLAAISALPTNQVNPYECFSTNTAGTANVLEASRQNDVKKVIFASTSAIYENNFTFPCSEEQEVTPTLNYSLSKLQAEQICKAYAKNYGMRIPIIRYFNAYGPNQDIKRKSPPLTGYLIKCFLTGETPKLHSTGEQSRDYCHVKDIIDLNLICMESVTADNEIFNACSERAITVNKIYKILADAFKTNVKPTYAPATEYWIKYPELYTGPFSLKSEVLEDEVNKFTLGTNKKAREVLGWLPKISMEDGLTAMAKHYKDFKWPSCSGG